MSKKNIKLIYFKYIEKSYIFVTKCESSLCRFKPGQVF